MKYTRGDTVVSFEKLWFLQKRHAEQSASVAPENTNKPSDDLRKLAVIPILNLLTKISVSAPERLPFYLSVDEEQRRGYIESIVYADALSMNYTTPSNFIERNRYFFSTPTSQSLRDNTSALRLRSVPVEVTSVVPQVLPALLKGVDKFQDLEEGKWTKTAIKELTNEIIREGAADTIAQLRAGGVKHMEDSEPGKALEKGEDVKKAVEKSWGRLVHGYIRWAVVSGMPGPEGAETMQILGREESLRRLETAKRVAVETAKVDVGEA